MTADPKIAEAEARSGAARRRLLGTVDELKVRLQPATLAHNATQELRLKSLGIVRDGAEIARANPIATVAVVAGLVAVVARRPLIRLFRRRERDR